MSELPRGQAWQTDLEAAFVQARRLISACAEQKGEVLYLGSLELDRLPSEISALTWLRELRMFGGSISDFTPLTPLTNLELLEIGSLKCPFPGLDFMRDWDKLQDLDIITPSAVDVKPAAACLGLKRLTIWCTPRQVDLLNLETLSGLRAIEHVSFYGMASERFDTLTQWPRLKFVQLTNPTLATLAGFERLDRLEDLSIRGASISDLSPLAGLTSLEQLVVHDTEISDLSPLVRLHRLEKLDISGTPACDLGPWNVLAHVNVNSISDSEVSKQSGGGIRAGGTSGSRDPKLQTWLLWQILKPSNILISAIQPSPRSRHCTPKATCDTSPLLVPR